ncbi:protein IQ-DOMAIN 19-like isoform X3 [Telopea speciosissima]|uniref:protein IQ-DOMAIN 19-like isoform X3 n=1 Tax=Telopea speciosissima TaxID=54955 RepID=UPI001CC59265|nr:protein IQ-DOMAIN 19-like isoform X3 [Telopea speciosissima]
MGMTSKWIRSFLTSGKKDKQKEKGKNSNSQPTSIPTENPTTPIIIPPANFKEKRRWSFRRSSATGTTTKDLNSMDTVSTSASPVQTDALMEADNKQKKHAMAVAAAQADATVIHLTKATALPRSIEVEEAAVIKIQAAFRCHLEIDTDLEENIKMVEIDLGQPRESSNSRKSYSNHPQARVDPRFSAYYPSNSANSKEDHLHISSAPSALTEMSSRACSGHFEEYSFTTAQGSPQYYSAMSKLDPTRTPIVAFPRNEYADSTSIDYPFYPHYMGNTQSSRAKVRSHSTPKQRSESFERQTSSRRSTVEGSNIPRGVRMQCSSSHVGSYQYPLSIKLDRSSVSLQDSECGSTSTVLTNTSYCRSLAAFEVGLLCSNPYINNLTMIKKVATYLPEMQF